MFQRPAAARRRSRAVTRRHSPGPAAATGKSRAAPVWFFDLDDTLHDASHAIFGAIDRRMTDYVERVLAIERAEANRLRTLYWRRYGATLLGLVRHHNVDAGEFLRESHDFDVAKLLRAERGLAGLFARLPGRKILITNAPREYAGSVLRGLTIHRHFRGRYTIESMRVHGRYRPKPSRLMLRVLLAGERVQPDRAILVEDSLPNIRSGKAIGMRTVLLTRHGRKLRLGQRGGAGLRIASLHQLARRVPRR